MKPYYNKDGITIYHGDCREVLPCIAPKGVAMVTDPPYGTTQHEWDRIDSVKEMIALSGLAVFTTGERLLATLITTLPDQYRHIWVWDRVNHNTDFLNASRRPMRSHELIAVFSKEPSYPFEPVMRDGYQVSRRTQPTTGNGAYGHSNVERSVGEVKTKLHPRSIIAIPGSKTNSQLHPTEKPIALYQYLLMSYPVELVFDPYMGSGTTLVAAKLLGRRAIGIEIEERYCEIAANRLAQGILNFAG